MIFFQSLLFRIIAGITMLILGPALSYRHWIRPLETRHAETVQRMDELRVHIQSAEKDIMRILERKQQGDEIRNTLSSLHDDVPAHPAITWFPSRMKTMLSRLAVNKVSVSLNKTAPEPLLPEYERTYWLVSVPAQAEARKFTDVLLAVAQIEQQNDFVQIEGLSFHLELVEPGGTSGYVNLMAFVPSEQAVLLSSEVGGVPVRESGPRVRFR